MPGFLAKTFGMPKEFIVAITNVWTLFRSFKTVDAEKVKHYCDKVTEMYYKLFPWSQMPPSMHKLLSHGYMYIENLPANMGPGMFNEEPLESLHKTLKKFVQTRSCQMSRKRMITDVFKRQLDISDPQINNKLGKYAKKENLHDNYPHAVLDLQ